jgi:hypothetical protein
MDEVGDKFKDVRQESMTFFKYVFNFDTENKARIMNMLQYTLISIVPLILLLRGVKHIFPEEDESKGSLEILAESVGQLLTIMLGFWFINKLVTFIPTYSGHTYNMFNETTFVLPFVLILITMQTKLGAKVNILVDRAMRTWTGDKPAQQMHDQQQGQAQVRVTQPLAGGHMPSQADHLDRNQLLPSNLNLTAMPTQMAAPKQQQPDYNSMYQQGGGGGAPQMSGFGGMSNEPMAANEMGGAFGGSPW